jgi:hypothetical protein
MNARKLIILAGALAAVLSCGPKKKSAPVVQTRDFPMVEVPMMITQPQERVAWLAQHFWDSFTAVDSLYFCDSVTVNGVPVDKLEQQMGLFASLLQEVPLSTGQKAMEAFYGRLEAFQQARPAGNVLPQAVTMATHYFYDPNSPVRSEDLYLPLVSRLATSAFIDPDYRDGYAWDARMCALNRVGTPAADFVFIDTAGKRRTLYSIKAERTLLIFGNPDCTACKELVAAMGQYPEISAQIEAGSLKVVDIFIDEDIDLWRARMDAYPASWINGYDPSFTIRTELIYNVRAVPSLYLLDAKKTVLLKDATPEKVLGALL